MGNLDPAKVLVILVVALIVLGPERLPRVARQIAGVWRELVKVRENVVDEIRSAIPHDLMGSEGLPRIPRPTPGAVSGFVGGLMANGQSRTAQNEPTGEEDETGSEVISQTKVGDEATLIVVHPSLGDFAFIPDDPSMN